jgi:pimeloyl-ACP methyl ester carboxylesterase
MTTRMACRSGRLLLAVSAVAVLVAALSACNTQQRPANAVGTEPQIKDPATEAPGTLLESSPFPTVDVRVNRAHATATRITYRSTSGVDGSATAVTGVVFTPVTPPPADGWKVVAYGHPGVGMLEECAPSRYANLLGNGAQIEMLLREGYLVVMADYQGLGSKGPHPFLEPKTLGYNLIDAVRAARQLEPRAGTRWAGFGGAEGGEAAWAAAELAPVYGQGLDMVGAVAFNPYASMSAMPWEAFNRTLNFEQLPIMQLIVNAVAALHPDVPTADYLHGFVLGNNEALLQCSGTGLDSRNQLVFGMSAADVAPVSPEAAARLSAILQNWSVPIATAPTQVPIMIVVGSVDGIVWPDWTRDAARRGCEQGEQITWLLRAAEGHDNLKLQEALAWLVDRFNAVPLEGSCSIV